MFLTLFRRYGIGAHTHGRFFSTLIAVPASLVKQLRENTGAPMMECKNALQASGNDVSKAVDWLRKKGKAAASKSAGRVASQGLVAYSIGENGDVGSLIELNSETDFVARNVLFQTLAKRVAESAVASLPPSLATTSEVLGSEVALKGASLLLTASLAGGHVGGAGGEGSVSPCSVGDGITGVIAQVRENMVLRRAVVVGGKGCLVTPYIHNSPAPGLGSLGVLVALRFQGGGGGAAALSPTHPAAPALSALSRRLAMHIAASNPAYLNRGQVAEATLERERAVAQGQTLEGGSGAGKAPELLAKIVEGRLGKFYGEFVLGEQTFALGGADAPPIKVAKWLDREAKAAGSPPVEAVAFATLRVGSEGGSG